MSGCRQKRSRAVRRRSLQRSRLLRMRRSVKPGNLISPGRPLGTFINMNSYELRSAVSLGYADQLVIGQKVTFTSPDVSGSWSGKITRIAPVVDGASQSVSVVVTLQGNKLREGMYLTGQIKEVEVMNALRLPASMVFDNSYVFAIERDSVLAKISVEVVEWLDNEVIVRGIGQGTMLVNEPSLKAASGLVVTPVK